MGGHVRAAQPPTVHARLGARHAADQGAASLPWHLRGGRGSAASDAACPAPVDAAALDAAHRGVFLHRSGSNGCAGM
ncbi:MULTISPECIES: hypothetical protein [unclassified Streptomyces]|uniref:hypothetical protein n=1 Tax=unclassified Streptomyces TaxID=2593676 RepID=UPI00331F06FE